MKILHYTCDLRSVTFVILALGLIAVQWADVFRHPALYPATLALAFIVCVINHNHQHHPTFVSPSLNQFFGVLISLASGVPATAIIPMHQMNHHVHNNHDEDFVRASLARLPLRILNLLAFPFLAMARYVRYSDLSPEQKRRILR